MKSLKSILMVGFFTLASLCACTAKTEKAAETTDEAKMLVCYFSATGTTADAAKRIADIARADIYEITPEARYTAADLDWRDTLSRSYVEMHNRDIRPVIVDSLPDLTQYSVVFIGYPNWWNTHPTIVNTFIEAIDLNGKQVVPFMTSGGSNITNSEKELREQYPDLTFAKGLLMNSVSDEQIKAWIENL